MFIKLFELGYSPIPVFLKGKNPCIKEWSKYCQTRATIGEIEKWDDAFQKGKINIGLACGPASNVIAIDIDTDDKEFSKDIPLSPVVRRGKKGEARFFQFSQDAKSTSLPFLDIISDGRQIVLPPSIHPDGMRYEWLTLDTLLDLKPSELPKIDLNFIAKIQPYLQKNKIETVGRNNKLVDVVTAMRGRGESESEIVKTIYEWDCLYHSPRLFTDPKENFKADNEQEAKNNAWKFATSVTKSLIDKGLIKLNDFEEKLVIELNDEVERKPQHVDKMFPDASGVLQDIQNLIMERSLRTMPNIALGGAIAVMSALCANKFRYQRTWANMYVLNLAPTGAGKQAPQDVVHEILKHLKGHKIKSYGSYRSSPAFVKNLVTHRVRLDVIDEISALFSQIKDGGVWQNEILEEMCKIWSASSGKYLAPEYAEKEGGTCYNPCVSILGSSTIEGLKASIEADMMTKGLLPRFLIFTEDYKEMKKPKFDDSKMESIIEKLVPIAQLPFNEVTQNIDVKEGPAYNPIDMWSEATDDLAFEIQLEYGRKIEKEPSETLKAVLTRGYENIMKLAIIHAVSSMHRVVTDGDIFWGKSIFETQMNNSKLFLEESTVNDGFEKDAQSVLNLFRKKNFCTLGDVCNNVKRLDKKKASSIIDTLLTRELIKQAEHTSKRGKKTIGYILG